MSPKAGFILVQDIVPRIRYGVCSGRGVKTVGGEDIEELIQDATAHAALLLHRAEESGKEVSCGNIAYYALLHTRSGRRSTGGSRADVMAPGTQLDGKSCVLSFEGEEVGYDAELDEAIRLEDVLTCDNDDPSQAAGRNIDWEEFLDEHDCRYLCIIHDLASGRTMLDTARACKMTYNDVRLIRDRLVEELEEWMGPEAIADAVHAPPWRGNILVDREKTACRADRRRR